MFPGWEGKIYFTINETLWVVATYTIGLIHSYYICTYVAYITYITCLTMTRCFLWSKHVPLLTSNLAPLYCCWALSIVDLSPFCTEDIYEKPCNGQISKIPASPFLAHLTCLFLEVSDITFCPSWLKGLTFGPVVNKGCGNIKTLPRGIRLPVLKSPNGFCTCRDLQLPWATSALGTKASACTHRRYFSIRLPILEDHLQNPDVSYFSCSWFFSLMKHDRSSPTASTRYINNDISNTIF